MDIFFQDPNEIPLPPAEVRIRQLRAEPWPEGRRVRVTLEVDPFQKRPCAEVVISDAGGAPVAQASIIESMTRKMELNLHLRQPDPGGTYTLQVVLYYQPEVAEPGEGQPVALAEPMQVDQREISFTVT